MEIVAEEKNKPIRGARRIKASQHLKVNQYVRIPISISEAPPDSFQNNQDQKPKQQVHMVLFLLSNSFDFFLILMYYQTEDEKKALSIMFTDCYGRWNKEVTERRYILRYQTDLKNDYNFTSSKSQKRMIALELVWLDQRLKELERQE